jgi:hypothetical protein
MDSFPGYALAFIFAAGAVTRDYHVTLSKALLHIPSSAYRHWSFLALGGTCGILAALLFSITTSEGDDPISATLRLHVASPPLRGLAVGAMFLILIRLRIFDTHKSGFGPDWFYVIVRDVASQAFVDAQARARVRFLNNNLQAAFAIANYFGDVESLIDKSIRTRPTPYRRSVSQQLNAALKKAPLQGKPDPNDRAWQTYYRSLTGICYDACGPRILRDMPGFKF